MKSTISTKGEPILALTLCENERELLVVSGKKSARIFELSTGNQMLEFEVHREQSQLDIYRVLRIPGGSQVIMFPLYDTSASIVDLRNLQGSRSINAPWEQLVGMAVSADGSTVATIGGRGWYRAGELRLWDVESGRMLTRISPKAESINTIAYSFDGTMIATGGIDGVVRIWDVDKVMAR